MLKRFVLATCLGLLGTSAAVADPVLMADPVSTTATGTPAACPQVVKFTFVMRSNPAQQVPVTYRFLRSDGGTSATYNALLGVSPPGGPGLSPTQYTWTLGGPTLPSFSGWVKVQIVTPQNVTSAPQNFAIKCGLSKFAPKQERQP